MELTVLKAKGVYRRHRYEGMRMRKGFGIYYTSMESR